MNSIELWLSLNLLIFHAEYLAFSLCATGGYPLSFSASAMKAQDIFNTAIAVGLRRQQ